jgi:hypothetical protein
MPVSAKPCNVCHWPAQVMGRRAEGSHNIGQHTPPAALEWIARVPALNRSEVTPPACDNILDRERVAALMRRE